MAELNKVVIVDDFEYDSERKQYVLTIDAIQNFLKEQGLESLFINMDKIRFTCSDRFYNYQYSEKMMWPEDQAKKEYYLVTDHQNVLDSKRVQLEDMKAIINSRRDLVELQHGVDFKNAKVIDEFWEKMMKEPFSAPTMRVMNRNRLFTYKERLNLKVINDLGVGY